MLLKDIPEFETKPTQFMGTFIKVGSRTMVWQNNIIMVGYVYLS